MESSPPVNYKGRIVVSTTDDTEAKVIEHYGGKKWRRIMNFLRGVENHSDECGKKVGEAYVCLRESNVPIHQHNANVKSVETTRTQAWMKHDSPGRTKVVDSPKGETDTGFSLRNVDVDYQFSPLEYGKASSPTIPHDNMPPYMEVFAWECLEATEDEKRWSKEPDPEEVKHKVVFHFGYGDNDPQVNLIEDGKRLDSQTIPQITLQPGCKSGKWYFEDGTEATNDYVVTANKHCHIEWQLETHDVTFQWNPDNEVKHTYQHGQKIGDMALPISTDECRPELSVEEEDMNFVGWYDSPSSSQEIDLQSAVTSDTTYYAQWEPINKTHDTFVVTFDPANGISEPTSNTSIHMDWASRIGVVRQVWHIVDISHKDIRNNRLH